MQRMKHLFFIFTLIFILAPSVWGVDFNCPGGRWVEVVNQSCNSTFTSSPDTSPCGWNSVCAIPVFTTGVLSYEQITGGIKEFWLYSKTCYATPCPNCTLTVTPGACPFPPVGDPGCGSYTGPRAEDFATRQYAKYEWKCPTQCVDNDGDGYKAYNSQSCPEGNDCNDNDPSINPATSWYKDSDNDKYSDGATLAQCTQPGGYKLPSALTATSGDCDDNDAAKNPVDNDKDGYSTCTGDCDDNNSGLTPATIWHKDSDGDGYTDNTILTQCEKPTGYKLTTELTSTEYDCNDNNPLVTGPSVWYKDTDNDGYSDGTTMTSCTRPIGFKPASELKAASGDNDDTDASTYPGAPEICGDKKDNNQNGQTDEGCCNVSVSVSPTEVWPKNAGSSQTTSTITVSLTNSAPQGGCTVNFTVEPPNLLSGGHVHNGNRPKGKITDSNGNVINNLTLSNTENSAMVKYTSSEVSGEERIKIKLNNNDAGELAIKVRVHGLQPMPFSGEGHWRLTGFRGTHPDSHYGTPSTKARVAAMASDYFEDTGIAIGVNDMSLEKGGLFDINASWSTPHIWHRIGKSVDVDHLGVDEDTLDKKALQYGCKRHEVNLIHYQCP